MLIISQLAAGMGEVEGVGAKAAEILPDTEGQAVVAIGKLRPAIKRETVSPAQEQLALREGGRDLIARRAVFPGPQSIFHLTVTHQIRHAGKGQGVLRLAAVAPLNGDREIAAGRGWIEIFQHKRPRRNRGLIDNVTVLANRHRGIAARDAAHFRRVTAQAGGQHIVIGLQGNPTQANGVKHLRGGKRFTGINLGTQGTDIPL